MTHVELLTIEERFQLEGIGLRLLPDFPVPKGIWRDREDKAAVVSPDGSRIEAIAQFGMSHFNIRDSNVSVDLRWRITVTLVSVQKEQVPIGSKLLVTTEVRDAILAGAVA